MAHEQDPTRDERWERRFRTPWVLGARVARARPERGLAVTNHSGRFQLHAWDVAGGTLRQLTDREGGVLRGDISPDGAHVAYLDDTAGNEVGHLVRVPFGGGAAQDVTPDLPPYATFGWSFAESGTLLGLTTASEEGHALVVVDLAPDGGIGTARTLHRAERFFLPPVLSPQGDLAVIATTERTGRPQMSLLAFDTRSGAQVGDLWDGGEASLEAGPFAPGSEPRMAGTSDRTGFRRPFLWNPRTGERTDLPVDDLPGDLAPADWSADGADLLLIQTHDGVCRLHRHHLPTGRTERVPHPAGFVGGAMFGPGGEVLLTWEDATQPGRVLAVADGGEPRTILAAGDPPPGHPLRSVSFPSADGTTVQGWLGTPDGPGPFPTILHTHGGPESAALNEFSPEAQAWLDRGFAFLTVNYRGSTTFGRTFQQQIWGRLGEFELADMVAARDWLVREGVARPDLIFPSGWSYGGYLTLLALGRRPDLWAGGMAGVAVADWAMLWEDSAENLRGYCTAIFEGTPAERPEQYRASSPLTDVERVAAPVLVLQGRNDSRTPARPVEVYVERLRALGRPVEIDWFDSGHLGGFGDVELGIAHQARMLAFAERIVRERGGA